MDPTEPADYVCRHCGCTVSVSPPEAREAGLCYCCSYYETYTPNAHAIIEQQRQRIASLEIQLQLCREGSDTAQQNYLSAFDRIGHYRIKAERAEAAADQQRQRIAELERSVCVGEHVPESLADEAAKRIARLRELIEETIEYLGNPATVWGHDLATRLSAALEGPR